MVSPRTRMGEGFVSTSTPSPIIACGNIEPPSPAAEVGFIRLRPSLKMPELGQARVRVGEGTIAATTFALRLMSKLPPLGFIWPKWLLGSDKQMHR